MLITKFVQQAPALTEFRRWWVLVMFYFVVVSFLSSATLRGRLFGR